MFLWLISNLKRQIDKSIVVLAAFLEQAKPSRKRCLGRLDVKDNKILVVDDVCKCGSPVEWFRPYPGKVNAVRSVWLWLCDRDDGFEYFRFARQEDI